MRSNVAAHPKLRPGPSVRSGRLSSNPCWLLPNRGLVRLPGAECGVLVTVGCTHGYEAGALSRRMVQGFSYFRTKSRNECKWLKPYARRAPAIVHCAVQSARHDEQYAFAKPLSPTAIRGFLLSHIQQYIRENEAE